MKIPFSKKIITQLASFAVVLVMVASGCKKNEEEPAPVVPEPLEKTYTLKQKDVIGISGTVTFKETSTGSSKTKVIITLAGVNSGSHPAHIHSGAAAEGGAIVYSLQNVDGTGHSETVLDVSFATLINYDGYVNVHLDSVNINTIIAQGDIGGNQLTGDHTTYNLTPVGTSTVAGTANFEKRKNGNTLVTIQVSNTIAGMMHPAHIHLGSVATVGGGPIVRSLNDVDGTTGKSVTNVRALDSGTGITYAQWLIYDGYINIHESMTNLANIIAQGNIGSN